MVIFMQLIVLLLSTWEQGNPTSNTISPIYADDLQSLYSYSLLRTNNIITQLTSSGRTKELGGWKLEKKCVDSCITNNLGLDIDEWKIFLDS